MKKIIFIQICLLLNIVASAQLSVVNLRCESTTNPLGIEAAQPKLSWQLQSSQQNVLQTAYRILVADDEALLKKNIGNVWDSKQIKSSASIQVAYAGKALQSTKKYFWKVQVWDNKANASAWSSTAHWQMGLQQIKDWSNAKWIGYDEPLDSLRIFPLIHQGGKRSWGARRNVLPIMRKEFSVQKQIKSATAFICGLGHFELFINGTKTGDHFLDPGWTNYAKQAQYVSFDVTKQLQQGKNAIAVMLGNGFYYIPGQRYRKMTGAYGHPKMIMRTLVEYADGTTENIISDESWSTASSPIIFSSIFGGEDYDATLEQTGWSKPGFNAAQWKKVITTTGPQQLIAQSQPPVKIMQRFNVKNKKELSKDVTVYDLGQNFSGIPSVTVSGGKYDTIKIYCGELINADGTVNQKATGSPSYFTYILNGNADESWHPQFSYTGFRYMQVHCIAKDSLQPLPIVKNIEGLHIRSAMQSIGSFNCSNELFNQTNTLIDWAIKSNAVSLFTDCPHREKLGWLEQTHLMGSSVQYNYDIATLNRKMVNDMVQTQYANGKIPEIAPEFTVFTPPFDESPEWGSAAIILPWYNYKWYGDKQTLLDAYPAMKKYVAYLLTKDSSFILKHGLGDWFDIGPKKSGFAQMTKMGVTATATLYYDLNILTDIAILLNKSTDAKEYKVLATEVKKAFNKAFFNSTTLQYDSASQTANAMALYMGLVEPQYKNAVVNALIKDIKSRNNGLTAGDIGYRYVLRALEEAGRSDIIFDMNSRDDVPGYGFQLKHGATALTESWQAYESVSNNHFMLGHLMEWFFAGLAGIQQSNTSVAYKEVVIKPEVVGDITNAKASFESPYGVIKSEWTKTESVFNFQVQIPANSTAVIYIPAKKGQTVLQNGKKATVVYASGKAVVKVGSGDYQFSVANN
ncbi:alpha-L-rhamnosidase [Lacibacter luteus]|uniref:alpha-L-rhamnosidase n=1 Tax=Lacibacter luteus TaxID=2508719 RepID=A0A4Q1CDZ8_9BACT|nr:family 78 glycoside hydrolase catalytic domain [Lacibacter luteus]RXK57989.1 alpha-L-rhamnosidase [Lacibacter luteus]